jgi:NAD(P)-dependent dehydrogenase (short-subunit alcohol dehydrogenase family)
MKENFGRVDLTCFETWQGYLVTVKILQVLNGQLISKLDRDWMEKTCSVNVVGPVMLSKELAPLLAQVRRTQKKESEIRAKAIIANLSARVGSISDNKLGGWYSYRMSKSELNQATRTMAHELKRQSMWYIALHPGTTDTDFPNRFKRMVKKGGCSQWTFQWTAC